MTFTSSLKRGLVAGVCAGIVAALFAFVVAEPTINRSIALEGQRAAATSADRSAAGQSTATAADPVSRDVQRRVGAPAGFVLVGLGLGAMFGLLYAGLSRVAGDGDPWRRSIGLAASAVAAVVVVPFLRYPPNPPGVGDPDTINERTRYYLAALLLGIAVVVGAWRLLRYLCERGWPPYQRQLATAVPAVIIVALGFLVMPTPADAILIPPKLLWDFRIQSLATQLLVWGTLAAVFGVLTERAARASR
ncbi:MAG: hypothetical protein QOG49_731 [Frankiaceae bacterium]|jgi:predicted cobalt transporter CbtA|nr:hypothetical protein [Frankiaceae bacterium]